VRDIKPTGKYQGDDIHNVYELLVEIALKNLQIFYKAPLSKIINLQIAVG
jgi:hypothetical protein